MAKKLMVGEVLDVAAQGIGEPYEDYEAEYESLLNGLVTSLSVGARHAHEGDDEYYALVDLLVAVKDLCDTIDSKIDALETRVDVLEGYHE